MYIYQSGYSIMKVLFSNINKKWYFIFSSPFLILLFSNLIFPITYDDDFIYSKVGNPFLLQWEQYFTWHGRFITHSLNRIVLQLGYPYTDIITSFLGLLLLILSYFHINPYFLQKFSFKDKALFILLSVMIFSLLGGSWTSFTQTTFFMSYYFTIILLLFFLIPYRLIFEDSKYKPNINYIIIMGLLAGTSHEQAIAILPILFLLAIILHCKKIAIPFWYWIGVGTFCIGFLFLFLAPSTTSVNRLVNYGNAENWVFMGQKLNWLNLGWKRYFYSLFNWLFLHTYAWIPQGMIYFIIFGIFFIKNLKSTADTSYPKLLDNKNILPLLYFILAWGIVCVMMFSPLYYQAACNMGLIFLFIAVVSTLYYYNFSIRSLKYIKICSIIIGAIIWGIQVPAWIIYYNEYNDVVKIIQKTQTLGKNKAIVKPFTQFIINTPFGGITPVYLYRSSGFYIRMAEYYNIKEIIIDPILTNE